MNDYPLLFTPNVDIINHSNVTYFMKALNAYYNINIETYDALHAFSCDNIEKFWHFFWNYADIIAPTQGDRVLTRPSGMFQNHFFPNATINYAENMLCKYSDNTGAITFLGEHGYTSFLTRYQLKQLVYRYANALRQYGVKKNDVIAAYMPNIPETIIAMLASTAIGAIWTSCSPDFGVNGVVERFNQAKPTILFTVDGYFYSQKCHYIHDKVQDIAANIPSIKTIITVDFTQSNAMQHIPYHHHTIEQFLENIPDIINDFSYEHVPFNHPLYIMYSSGTTGKPKCIYHGHGGTLLKHLSEHILHGNIYEGDKLFYFTTCGWMMWNWLASGLGAGAHIMLFDGSPFSPTPSILWDYAAKEHITHVGISAKYISALEKTGFTSSNHNLEHLRYIFSTGSPLAHESFDYIYNNIKSDVHVCSISGGTDIIGVFVGAVPNNALYRGVLQAPLLGIDMRVYDDQGLEIHEGKGELVCIKPFPSMPIYFGDDADNCKYKKAYFGRFHDIWCHGDFIEAIPNKGYVIHGRSDTTLNPGGIRIGTAEIYRQVEQLPTILEAVAVGKECHNDIDIVLFVVMRDGYILDDTLIQHIKQHIRHHCSPRHVPAYIIATPDIPRTKSGKITELAVRDAIHGRTINNTEVLANPDSLEFYYNIMI